MLAVQCWVRLKFVVGLVSWGVASSASTWAWPQGAEPPANRGGETTTDEQTARSTSVRWDQLPKAEDGVWLFAGESLGPWQVANASYFDKHGAVQWQADVLSLGRGRPGTGVVAQFEVPRNNYEISFQARRLSGEDFFCGLTFPFDDQQATLILGGWGGAAVGISNINNFSAIENLSSRNFPFEQERWYDVRFRVTRTEIELWIDGKSVFQFEPEEMRFSIWWEQRPMAPLGFATWNTAAEFRQLRLKKLPE
jgi:hypothetical protein